MISKAQWNLAHLEMDPNLDPSIPRKVRGPMAHMKSKKTHKRPCTIVLYFSRLDDCGYEKNTSPSLVELIAQMAQQAGPLLLSNSYLYLCFNQAQLRVVFPWIACSSSSVPNFSLLRFTLDLSLLFRDEERQREVNREMTLFHFFNCAILTFGPHAVYFSATPLYPSLWKEPS